MTERWAAERTLFTRCFAPLVESGYQLQRTDVESYWKLHEAVMKEHFPAEVFLDTSRLRSPDATSKQNERTQRRDDHPLRDFTILWKDGEVVAQFAGEQKSSETYRMWHSNVHTAHRRKGLYGTIIRSTLDYTLELGFDKVVSEHAPGNNPVLIAKLKAGFRITGLDVEPTVGVSVHLTYFHDADQLAAYQWRCGLATLTPKIVESGRGAMPLLRKQLGD